jgi:glycosyltransferase involved in cell wall biosynthesis
MSSLNLTRATVGLSEDAYVVGFIGSIFIWHGVDLIVDAVCELRKAGHNVVALIVGDGQIADNLKDRADQLGESGAFTWTGTINHHDTWAYARLSDCLVMTKSNWYGSPIKLFEYALAQRPIIAPNTDPVSEVMVNGLHGLLINPNVEELKTCILTLMRDTSLSQSLSDSWLNRVIQNHTWKRNAQMALNII